MAVSSTQMVALGAAAVIGYMTWSTVQTPGGFAEPEAGSVAIVVPKHSTSPPIVDDKVRDPFVRPGEMETWRDEHGGAGEGGAASPLRLAGIVLTGGVQYAYVNGARLRVGDEYRGYRLARIAHNYVEMTNGPERFGLWLNAAGSESTKAGAGLAADTAGRSYIKIITESQPAGPTGIGDESPAMAPGSVPSAPPPSASALREPSAAAVPAGGDLSLQGLGETEDADGPSSMGE